MKTLLLEGTASAGQPFPNRSWELIQEAYTEIFEAIMKGTLGDPDQPYIIYGCETSPTINGVSLTAGAVYHSGVIYLVDAEAEVVATTGGVFLFNIETSYDPIDPITFTDGSTHSVHRIRKAVLSYGTSGSGNFDYDDCIHLRDVLTFQDVLPTYFKVYNSSTSAWEASATHDFELGSYIKANKIGDMITLNFYLVTEFNDGVLNDLSFNATKYGFDLPAWLQPLQTSKIIRVVSADNSESSTYNSPESCELNMWTADPESNAPDIYFRFFAFDLDGSDSRTMKKSGAFFNWDYSTGTPAIISTSNSFEITIQGEITYQAANYDLPHI